MTSSLPTLYGMPGLPSRVSRQVARQHAAIEAQAELVRRQDQLRVERVTAVTAQCVASASQIASLERACAIANPHAAARISAIADASAGALLAIVVDAGMSH